MKGKHPKVFQKFQLLPLNNYYVISCCHYIQFSNPLIRKKWHITIPLAIKKSQYNKSCQPAFIIQYAGNPPTVTDKNYK